MKKFLPWLLILAIHFINAQDKKNLTDEKAFESPTNQDTRIKQESEFRLRNDWAFKKRYRDENIKLMLNTKKEHTVVFIGNSITEGWKYIDSGFFVNNHYINRGIGGQVSGQMLLRFRSDVIDIHPKAVVILAGINDIAENMGPISLEDILGNIISMAELAKANQIKVILCSVLPAYDFPWRPMLNPAGKVISLNAMIRAYAQRSGVPYVDYHTPLADEKNGLKSIYGSDGVHPNIQGYKIMEPLVQNEIKKTLNVK